MLPTSEQNVATEQALPAAVTFDEQHLLDEIELQVGARNFEHWFRGKVTLRFDGEELTVGIGSAFLVAWMQKNFLAAVSQSARSVLGINCSVRFALKTDDISPLSAPTLAPPVPDKPAESPQARLAKWNDASAVPAQPPENLTAAVRAVPAKANETGPQNTTGARRFSDLADFVSGPCNELALAAARQICCEPGVRFNPLVVYGEAGTGKTHLLEGIYRLMRRRHPSCQVLYLTAEEFANHFTQALKNHTLPSFRQRFRGVDVLLVDDVDFFDGKRATHEEFLHTFQQLESHGRQIVVSSDRHPRLFTKMSSDLSTRFVSGLVCRLESPDLETRRRILDHKAARLGDEIAPEALALLAQKFRNNIRELEGALKQLESHHVLTRKRITLATARQIIAEHDRDIRKPVRIPDVEQAVCRFFGIAASDLKGARRHRSLAQPRMLAMFLIRKHTHAAYSQIGEYFGGRNHSTVMAAEKRVRELSDAGETIRVASRAWKIDELIDALEDQLQAC